MPYGQKSKLRAREKRRQARSDTHSVKGAQTTTAEEEGSPSSSSPPSRDSPESSPAAAGIPQEPPRVQPITTATVVDASGTGASGGAEGQDEGGPSSSAAPAPTERSQRDPVTRRVSTLLQFLLHKYKMKEPITKAEMLKIVNKRYKEHFSDILRRATEHMELVFGLDLKEVDSTGQSYTIVSKLEITKEENLSGGRGFPKTRLLMPLLGIIILNGNRATEDEIWEFLSFLGIYDGKRHFMLGDPRRLITRDIVKETYLEYQEVPNSYPPRYEFLWGPRAHAEANEEKVLEFLVKINDTDPRAFQALYEETWVDEAKRAAAGEWAGAGPNARAWAHVRAKSTRSFHP